MYLHAGSDPRLRVCLRLGRVVVPRHGPQVMASKPIPDINASATRMQPIKTGASSAPGSDSSNTVCTIMRLPRRVQAQLRAHCRGL